MSQKVESLRIKVELRTKKVENFFGKVESVIQEVERVGVFAKLSQKVESCGAKVERFRVK